MLNSEIDPNAPPLTDFELEELVRTAPAKFRVPIARLCAEVKTLRDQQSAREFQYNQEIAW